MLDMNTNQIKNTMIFKHHHFDHIIYNGYHDKYDDMYRLKMILNDMSINNGLFIFDNYYDVSVIENKFTDIDRAEMHDISCVKYNFELQDIKFSLIFYTYGGALQIMPNYYTHVSHDKKIYDMIKESQNCTTEILHSLLYAKVVQNDCEFILEKYETLCLESVELLTIFYKNIPKWMKIRNWITRIFF